jgi:hypothetical protein
VRPIAVPYLWRILNLINLTNIENDYDAYLFKTFDISIDELKSEIRLLKYIPNTEMLKGSSTVRLNTQWLQWLYIVIGQSDRANIFNYFNKTIELFSIIPVQVVPARELFLS